MDLILDLAENHADYIANGFSEGFDGDYEPLKVPKGIVGVVENVFEVTDGVDGRGVEALEELKEAVAPILDLSGEDGEPTEQSRYGKQWGQGSTEFREMMIRNSGKGDMVSEGNETSSEEETVEGNEVEIVKERRGGGAGTVSLPMPEVGGSFTSNHRFDKR